MDSYIKWIACVVCCGGALLTSLRIDPINIYLLNAGAVLYLVWSIRARDVNLMIVNGVLVSCYGVGLFI